MKRKTLEQYKIVRPLAASGSGVVYLANDTHLERPVVLKVLRSGVLTAEQMRSTVLREARLASAIDHPNVCSIYEVGESGDEAYISMQYVPGQPLDQLIARGPMNVQLALSVGLQIADGLMAAHMLGIYHRDLKPQNLMLTDGGLVKILDFGLARRHTLEDARFDPAGTTPDGKRSPAEVFAAQGGTIRYMAPELFVTGRAGAQADVWALGVILFELASGRHPFAPPDAEDVQVIRAIQFQEPPDLSALAPEIPAELKSVILGCLEKNPATRYAAVAEVREALKTVMKTLQLDTGGLPAGAAAGALAAGSGAEKQATGFLSVLAERFREPAAERVPQNSIVVLPFVNLGASDIAPLYGFALADAIAARLARIPRLVVRPTSTLMASAAKYVSQVDPLVVGKNMMVSLVLAGNFVRSESGFDLNWQLLDVATQSVRTGGAFSVASLDLIAVQTEIANDVFAALQGMSPTGRMEFAPADSDRAAPHEAPLSGPVSETYLQGRAMLSSFMAHTGSRADLDRAHALLTEVTAASPKFAAGWCGLGVAEIQYVRYGFGGQIHVVRARRAVDEALKLDPASTEANLYRIYMLMPRGEKESARHGIADLLTSAANDWSVHRVAGVALRCDGMYEEALLEFGRALKLSPSNAVVLYNHRARVYHYLNQMELAADELEKGLALEPHHPLLRASLGYQQMRKGNLREAIKILESVHADSNAVRIAAPTLALCYVQAGDRKAAALLLKEDTLTAAEADSEMAYRLATYFAVEGDSSEALHWLRRAIYLGNENYPWFSKNPAWNNLRTNADFERILEDLKKGFQRNQKTWKRLLEQSPRARE
jgi:serine/threonine-protein kinase